MPGVPPLRLVFATIGSRGDVQPMLSLALYAQAQGHDVLLAAPPDFGEWARSSGLPFHPVGQDIQAFLSGNPDALTSSPAQMFKAVGQYFRDEVPQQTREFLVALQGADALVWAGLAGTASSVAEKLGIRSVAILYTTCLLPSKAHPPPALPLYGLPGWMNRLLWWVDNLLIERTVGAPIHKARAQLGLPAMPLRTQIFGSSDFVIAADEVLFPSPPDWGKPLFQSTFIFHDDARELDADLVAWLDAGEPPIFAGFGSMSGPGPRRAAAALPDALATLGRRGLVGSGWAGLGGTLPQGWRVVGDVPHAKLFPRVAAVVHHGGSGTTATALRAGVPQVILPLFLDQHHHAHGLYRAGLGGPPVRMERVEPGQLSQMIAKALSIPWELREPVARRLVSRDARSEILRRVELVAGGGGAGATEK